VEIKNSTNTQKNVKVGWCIYNSSGQTLLKGNFNKRVNANSSLINDFYVKDNVFSQLKSGKYKSQFWVNDERVQKEYFTIAHR